MKEISVKNFEFKLPDSVRFGKKVYFTETIDSSNVEQVKNHAVNFDIISSASVALSIITFFVLFYMRFMANINIPESVLGWSVILIMVMGLFYLIVCLNNITTITDVNNICYIRDLKNNEENIQEMVIIPEDIEGVTVYKLRIKTPDNTHLEEYHNFGKLNGHKFENGEDKCIIDLNKGEITY